LIIKRGFSEVEILLMLAIGINFIVRLVKI
jgi:hypothetical protein